VLSIALCAVLAFSGVPFAGCGAEVELSETTRKAIERAIRQLTTQSAEWQKVLKELQAKLAADASSLATQVGHILQENEEVLFEETSCTAEEARLSVLHELQAIRVVNWVVKEKPTLKPFPCAVVPHDISVKGIREGTVPDATVLGFDFRPGLIDARLPEPRVSFELTHSRGPSETIEPGQFITSGPYRITLNLAAYNEAKPLTNDVDSLKLLFNGAEDISEAITPAGVESVSVTTPGARTSYVDRSETLQITATSVGGETLTFSASGLPAGLAINAATGLISGTPTTPESTNVTVIASTPDGSSGSASFPWTIAKHQVPPPPPPPCVAVVTPGRITPTLRYCP
jgi:hypothetical protein